MSKGKQSWGIFFLLVPKYEIYSISVKFGLKCCYIAIVRIIHRDRQRKLYIKAASQAPEPAQVRRFEKHTV